MLGEMTFKTLHKSPGFYSVDRQCSGCMCVFTRVANGVDLDHMASSKGDSLDLAGL